MKHFLPILFLTGLLFGQDTLRTVSGQVVIGKLMEQEEEYVFFKPDGAQQSQKIPIRLIKEIRLGNGEIIDFGNDYLTAVNNNSPLIDSTMVNNNSIIAQEDASGLTLEKDGEQVFSQSGLYVTGGITNSIVDGEDVTKDVDYLMGFKFGIERIHENGLIAGAAYTQRGFSESRDLFGIIERDSKHNTNYLSGYILKLFPVSSNIDLLVGGEVGYFLSAKSKTKTCIDNECESETETIDGKDWKEFDNNMIDYGLILGSRYTINKKLYLFGTYYWGLAQLNNDDEVRHRGLQINLSYAFNGPKIYL